MTVLIGIGIGLAFIVGAILFFAIAISAVAWFQDDGFLIYDLIADYFKKRKRAALEAVVNNAINTDARSIVDLIVERGMDAVAEEIKRIEDAKIRELAIVRFVYIAAILINTVRLDQPAFVDADEESSFVSLYIRAARNNHSNTCYVEGQPFYCARLFTGRSSITADAIDEIVCAFKYAVRDSTKIGSLRKETYMDQAGRTALDGITIGDPRTATIALAPPFKPVRDALEAERRKRDAEKAEAKAAAKAAADAEMQAKVDAITKTISESTAEAARTEG